MEILNLDNSNKETEVEIDLSEYKEPVIIPEPPTESPIIDMGIPPIDDDGPEVIQDNPVDNEPGWKGNPEYFQTGAKAGQKRQRKPRTRMQYTGTYEESTISADIITGAMFISLVDLLIPMLFVTINNYLTGEKLKPTDLSLSAEQCRKLEPVADKAMSYIKLRGNPLIILGLTLLGMYSMQLVKAKMEYKVKKMNESENEKK